MAMVIILGLICFVLLSGVAYLILFFPTKWFVKTDKLKVVRLILSPLTVILIMVFYLFVPIRNNDDTATIEKYESKYIITLTEERALMVHDPISALKEDTYLETFKIIIPRAKGFINGQEIPTMTGYKMFGTLNIDKDKIVVDLYYDNYDDKTKDPLAWNGVYKLKKVDN